METKSKYGVLVELGQMRSKFVCNKRNNANGLKRSKSYLIRTQESLNINQHSITCTFPTHTRIDEYEVDSHTDMFQIGRSKDYNIDFVITEKLRTYNENTRLFLDYQKNRKRVSRFAFRILAERSGTSNVKIFAGAFDSNKTLFLGRKAQKWEDYYKIDGFTTNGVLIMHPESEFIGGESKYGIWLECSINGDIFVKNGRKLESINNNLKDGSLISLGREMTLLWRSKENFEIKTTIQNRCNLIEELIEQAYVYLGCGHVETNEDWGTANINIERRCKKCAKVSSTMKLYVAHQTLFYVDSGPLSFAFNPCGHIATEKTVKFWVDVTIPTSNDGFQSECPFCGEEIADYPGYVKLKF